MQRRKTAGKSVRTAAALLMALLLVVFLTAKPGLALDVSRPVSITVDFGEDSALDGEAGAAVVDLYYVGQTVDSVEDEISLRAIAPFNELDLSAGQDRDSLRRLTDAAMEIVLASGSPIVSGAAPGMHISAGDDGKPLAAGMYLVVPHGADLSPAEYCVRAEDESGEVHILTVATGSGREYTFQPLLLTLPILSGAEELYDIEISGSGEEFIYDARISFKYEYEEEPEEPEKPEEPEEPEEPEVGSLKIIKTLRSHRVGDHASFLFSVDVRLDGILVRSNIYTLSFDAAVDVRLDGILIRSNIYTLSFDAAGEQDLIIDDLPVGAEVTVAEVYSGASYAPVGPTEETVVIEAETEEEVHFVNDYEESPREGDSLINRFTYSGSLGWSWEKVPASEG